MKRQDWETCNMVAQPVAIRTANTGANGHGIAVDVTHTLDQAQGQAVAQPVAFHPTQDPISSTDGTTHAMGCGSKQGTATVAVAHAFKIRGGVEREDGSRGSTNIGKQAGKGYLGSDELAFTVASSPDQYLAQPAMQVRRLTPVECSRLQGFPDTYLELTYGTESEAHASQVLHELWKQTGAIAREGWRPGIVASLFTPEVLLAGVHGGWISWEMATCCAIAPRPLSSKVNYAERFVRRLQEAGQDGRSPYQRESFRQLSEELGCSLSQLPLEEAQARKVLLNSELWPQAQAQWPLRYALATEKQRSSGKLNADGPRYKALGNSMAVPCMKWIGERIQAATARQEVKP